MLQLFAFWPASGSDNSSTYLFLFFIIVIGFIILCLISSALGLISAALTLVLGLVIGIKPSLQNFILSLMSSLVVWLLILIADVFFMDKQLATFFTGIGWTVLSLFQKSYSEETWANFNYMYIFITIIIGLILTIVISGLAIKRSKNNSSSVNGPHNSGPPTINSWN